VDSHLEEDTLQLQDMPGEEVDTVADEVVGTVAVEVLDIAEVVEDTMAEVDTVEVAADNEEVADAELG